ncbi:MAG TPA: FecR domain-containing protein [Sphingomicrobium sp.]|nr:FecR domain-containing protein [Sphingomicrobium sp.]
MVKVKSPEITADMALAEAAAWLTALHDRGERKAATEAAFREWIEADPLHARAFAQVTDVWDVLPGAVAADEAPKSARRRRPAWAYAAAASVALAVSTSGYLWINRDPVYETPRGQQRSLELVDGSHIALNTDSKVQVDYSAAERRVELERGEVLFNVAKNPRRPFIVDAGSEEVRAVGTSFVVRRDGDGKVAVTLIQGVVKVTQKPSEARPDVPPPAILRAGERLTVGPTEVAALDRPHLEAVTAWRTGNIMLDDETLGDAVAEFNRYGSTQIVLTDPRLSDLRISGVFDANSPEQFVAMTASIHHLTFTRDGDRILLKPS